MSGSFGAKSGRIENAEAATPQEAGLQALFMTRLEFGMAYPGAARMLCHELQQDEPTPLKTIAQSVIRDFSEQLARKLEAGKGSGEADLDMNARAAGNLLGGAIQGLVMLSLVTGDVERMRAFSPEMLKTLLRGVGQPRTDREVLVADGRNRERDGHE